MKKVGLLVLATLFMVSVVTAQEQTTQGGQGMGHKREFRESHKGIATPQMRADRMAKELDLTDAEKAKVKELIEKQDANHIKMADEVNKVKQEFKTKFENQKKTNDVDLEKIIGKEKFQKLQSLRTEKMDKMKHHRENMRDGSTDSGKKGPAEM